MESAKPANISVLIVEDDLRTRERLVDAVGSDSSLSLFAAVDSLDEARRALAPDIDIVLVDLGLPDGSGIELIREIRSGDSKTECMVISVFADDKHVLPALKAGATGYLLKDTPFEEIPVAIINLMNGGSPISPAIARTLLNQFKPGERTNSLVKLTGREKEVLETMAKGFNYNETAELLNISYHTVISHVKKIYEKLAVNSRSQAVFEATQMGLI